MSREIPIFHSKAHGYDIPATEDCEFCGDVFESVNASGYFDDMTGKWVCPHCRELIRDIIRNEEGKYPAMPLEYVYEVDP